MKKIPKNKRRQIRRCSVCGAIGHNRGTCPKMVVFDTQISDEPSEEVPIEENLIIEDHPVPNPQKTAKEKTLNLFIHHTSLPPRSSEHIVDLKKEKIWENVEAVPPENTPFTPYHCYHEQQTQTHSPALKPLSPLNKKTFYKQTLPDFESSDENEDEIFEEEPVKPLKIKRKRRKFFEGSREKYTNFKNKPRECLIGFAKKYLPIKKAVVYIVVFSLLIIAPAQTNSYYQSVKNTAEGIADSGAMGFVSLQQSTFNILQGNLDEAQQTLTGAMDNFAKALDLMNEQHRWLQEIVAHLPIIGDQAKSGQSLISAGHNLTMGNIFLLKGITAIKQSNQTNAFKNLSELAVYLDASTPYYKQALSDLRQADPKILPTEYRNQYEIFLNLFGAFTEDLENISKLGGALEEIFGAKGTRRYLLIFQNPDELRPTGGFMGSLAIMDVRDGQITNMEVPPGGTYDLQGQLTEFIRPPDPLLLINDRWELQDANWFADFPTSAEKILWFFQKSRRLTADGVIAVNADVLTRVLNIFGPIQEENRGLVLTGENAISIIQKTVETGEEKELNKPKQIIADLTEDFIEKFKNEGQKNLLPIAQNLQEALAKKEIQVYFSDQTAQEKIKELGWDGGIIQNKKEQDYLMVVNSNIGGQKSDAKIKQTIHHQAIVQKNGDIIDTVTVTRLHSGKEGEEFYGAINIDYLRLYVPLGSELLEVKGADWPDEKYFKTPEDWYEQDQTLQEAVKQIGVDNKTGTRVTEEFNKTVFGNWIITRPSDQSQIQFTYKLPFKQTTERETKNFLNELLTAPKDTSSYQLIAQKQPGINSEFETQIIYPKNYSLLWLNGQEILPASNGAYTEKIVLEENQVWSIIMEKKQ